jgi:hypothetical protein
MLNLYFEGKNMSISKQEQIGTRSFPSKRVFTILGVLVLMLGLPSVSLLSSATTGASVSMSYSLETSSSGVHYIAVTMKAVDSQFPNTVTMILTSYYKGASSPYNTQSVLLSPGPKGAVSNVFLVSYKGAGNYLFVGSIYNLKGTLLCQATIDPHIEPEW